MIPDSTNPALSPLVHVDCANGVGAWKLRELMDVINRGDEVWNAKIVNDGSGQEDKLNENVRLFVDFEKKFNKRMLNVCSVVPTT